MFEKKHKIGDCIAKLRKDKGWTQNELAEKLQVSDKAISKWESNKGEPSNVFLPALAELFDVSLYYLMIGKENEILTLELIAKNDDVVNAEKFIGKNYSDEKGNCLLHYVYKYNSVNIFKKYKVSELMQEKYSLADYGIDNYLYMTIVSDKLSKDFFLNLHIDSISQIESSYYNDKLCDFITNNINESIVKNNILALYKKDNINAKGEWQDIYKKLIDYAVYYNNKKSSMSLLDLVNEINTCSIKLLNNSISQNYDKKGNQKKAEDNSRLSYHVHPDKNGFNYSVIYNYAVINIEVNTIKSALSKKWYDFVKLANQINI